MHQVLDSGVGIAVAAVVAVVLVAVAPVVLASFQCKLCSVVSWCWCRTNTCPAVDRPQPWGYADPSTFLLS